MFPLTKVEPVITNGPVLMSTLPNRVCVSDASSPNIFEPDENTTDDVWNIVSK